MWRGGLWLVLRGVIFGWDFGGEVLFFVHLWRGDERELGK